MSQNPSVENDSTPSLSTATATNVTSEVTTADHAPQVRSGTLRFVLPALKDSDEHRYGLVPYPNCYQDALQSAIEVLGKYRPSMTTENIILRYSQKNREGAFVWVDILPAHWSQLVHPGEEVAIYPLYNTGVPSGPEFVRGHLLLTFGTRTRSRTAWSDVSQKHINSEIDRPKSFKEANRLIQICIREQSANAGTTLVDLDTKKVRYYYFKKNAQGKESTDLWVAFPPAAYQDDDVWRACVPLPGSIFGFMLE
ncbi:hypothetical protein M422DRAFT_782967 [Sphaerobolus stellatus SS14]|uniref:Uncharacterized protein n=1 Tax=Sphaerobolus stellatus (strain SS14) TaxID=990650 RepID=A0A0C9TUT7_SPHS4|nr:hypothetical protein M422DRAFT_782967 [Sphaerobolus stellatus SS14]